GGFVRTRKARGGRACDVQARARHSDAIEVRPQSAIISTEAMAMLRVAFVFACSLLLRGQTRNLDIYWVDVEGGGSTLIVSPTGQSLLVDTGNPAPDDRDAKRIYAAAQMAGLRQIDMLLTTHYHGDHVGGAPALAKMIPISRFLDHGDSIEKGNNENTARLWNEYLRIAQGKRTVMKPGDKIPLNGVN